MVCRRRSWSSPHTTSPQRLLDLEAQDSDYLARDVRWGERQSQVIGPNNASLRTPVWSGPHAVPARNGSVSRVGACRWWGTAGQAPLAQQESERCLDLESAPDGVALLGAVFMYQHGIGKVLPEILDRVYCGGLDSFAQVGERTGRNRGTEPSDPVAPPLKALPSPAPER